MPANTPDRPSRSTRRDKSKDSDVGTSLSQLPEKEARVLKPIVESLPEEQRVELLQVIESHRGWLPPPAMMAEYERVLPGLAERIVGMPEREQSHRHLYVAEEADRQYRIRRRGQDYALIALVLILVFALTLAYLGQAEWAAKLVIGTLVGIVGIFVTGRWLDFKAENAGESKEDPD